MSCTHVYDNYYFDVHPGPGEYNFLAQLSMASPKSIPKRMSFSFRSSFKSLLQYFIFFDDNHFPMQIVSGANWSPVADRLGMLSTHS
jgi:hypothetical protein